MQLLFVLPLASFLAWLAAPDGACRQVSFTIKEVSENTFRGPQSLRMFLSHRIQMYVTFKESNLLSQFDDMICFLGGHEIRDFCGKQEKMTKKIYQRAYETLR